jgi:hypothetical protein
MTRRLLFLPLIASAALFAWDGDRFKEDFRYSYALQPGGRVELESFNGGIEILGWDRNEVEITGTKYASSEEILKQIRIETANTPGSVNVRVIRPPREGGWWSTGGGGVKMMVRVPKKVNLDRIASSNGGIRVEGVDGPARLTTSNGGIRVAGLSGSLDATSSNGGIEIRDSSGPVMARTSNGTIRAEGVKGPFEATTSNGAIRARLSAVPASSPIRLKSSNGTIELALEGYNNNEIHAETSNSSVTVNLPASINANLRASTSNASVTSDFDVTVRGAISKNRLEGKIGNGGGLIDLSSSNGSIRIQKM